jgi:hypothetical protein
MDRISVAKCFSGFVHVTCGSTKTREIPLTSKKPARQAEACPTQKSKAHRLVSAGFSPPLPVAGRISREPQKIRANFMSGLERLAAGTIAKATLPAPLGGRA